MLFFYLPYFSPRNALEVMEEMLEISNCIASIPALALQSPDINNNISQGRIPMNPHNELGCKIQRGLDQNNRVASNIAAIIAILLIGIPLIIFLFKISFH